jgi:hypothetical protein
MVIRENYKTREDGVVLYLTYSDTSHRIIQKPTMVVYDEAIDIEGAPYEYEETDELIEAFLRRL